MNLLLLRGLIRDQRAWGDFPRRFAAHAPHARLHFLDLPGVGTENRRTCPSSIPAIRIDVAKRFHDLVARGKFPKEPWSLMALSMGGMIGLDWVAAEPGLFRKLIVVNTSSADLASPFERFRIRAFPALLRALAANRPEDSERAILGAVSNRFVRDPARRDPRLNALFADHVNWRRDRPVSRTTFLRQFYSAARYRLGESRPTPDTVVISSEGDRLVNPRCSAKLAERLGAVRLSHPWAGHDLPIDDPEWLAREVSEWMGARA